MQKHTTTKIDNSFLRSNHTGIALLCCFLIATLAVGIALRQIVLERKIKMESLERDIVSQVAGEYSVTTNIGKLNSQNISLVLRSDRKAILISKLLSDEKSQELHGFWSGDSNSNIITSFKDKIFAFSYSSEGTGALRILNPDVELWGAATLTLTRK
ncbi:MAG: hypothetical protein E6R05_00495 [Candidatus Moraniibacteriota bacterium]|nr:MAG: hypothetical protein E6R05_00495 [Candidatus Moranbacteria bacterium]